MSVFIIRRLLQSILVVFAMATLVFFGVFAIGDPTWMFVAGDALPEDIEQARRQLGLDRPMWEQYFIFLGSALQGELGTSFVFGEPAVKLILERMPATMELALTAVFLSVVLGVPLGLYAGLYPEGVASRTIMATSIFGFSLPNFWVGIMLIMVFAVILGWVPSTGRGDVATFMGITSSMFTWNGLSHLILPAFNLALTNIALVTRLTRAGVMEAIHQDYIKFARAKGLSRNRIIGVHLLKNIMIPVVTVIGLEMGTLIAFAVVTETVFAWPGMGRLLIESIQQLDRPLIVAYLMMIVFLFVVINLIVDICYSLLDPRVRLGDRT
jgi:peptide/nickel transport system permease protein